MSYEQLKQLQDWYNELAAQPYSDMTQGQLVMLSNVLKMVLPKYEYKRLTSITKDKRLPLL